MKFQNTKIPGVLQIQFEQRRDERGSFSKVFRESSFLENGLGSTFREDYFSVSNKNVLRGMHFQIPPHDHKKIVYCILGSALDVVLDLRVGSPTYGMHDCLLISEQASNGLYIPSGIAHGFYAFTDSTILGYKTSTEYSPEHDVGIAWDSFGAEWPTKTPLCSKRDQSFLSFKDYQSPFLFRGTSKQPSEDTHEKSL